MNATISVLIKCERSNGPLFENPTTYSSFPLPLSHLFPLFLSFLNYRLAFFINRCLLFLLLSEAAVQRCSVKKVFLEISQNPQENTYASLF